MKRIKRNQLQTTKGNTLRRSTSFESIDETGRGTEFSDNDKTSSKSSIMRIPREIRKRPARIKVQAKLMSSVWKTYRGLKPMLLWKPIRITVNSMSILSTKSKLPQQYL